MALEIRVQGLLEGWNSPPGTAKTVMAIRARSTPCIMLHFPLICVTDRLKFCTNRTQVHQMSSSHKVRTWIDVWSDIPPIRQSWNLIISHKVTSNTHLKSGLWFWQQIPHIFDVLQLNRSSNCLITISQVKIGIFIVYPAPLGGRWREFFWPKLF